jgi:hypothetical protein
MTEYTAGSVASDRTSGEFAGLHEGDLLAVVLTSTDGEARHRLSRSPRATPEELANEPAPFPTSSAAERQESWYADWRTRLTRNLSRRSDGRWEPLTWFHAANAIEAAERASPNVHVNAGR